MSEPPEDLDLTDICDFAMAYGALSSETAERLTDMRILLELRHQVGMLDAFPGLVELRYQLRDISDRLQFFGRNVLEAAGREEERRRALARTPLHSLPVPEATAAEGGEA